MKPYDIIQAKKLPRSLDRRVKLTDDDKEAIRSLYKDGNGIREIARMYENKCTRRVIQYILFPERYAVLLANAKRRRKLKGNTLKEYGRKKWAETIKEHRHYKMQLNNNKLI